MRPNLLDENMLVECAFASNSHFLISSNIKNFKQIYPERDLFHITEVEGMLYIAAEWYNWCGNEENFLFYYDILSELSSDSASTNKLKSIALNNRF